MKSKKKKLRKRVNKYLFWAVPFLVITFIFGYKLNLTRKSGLYSNPQPTPTSSWKQQESIREMKESMQETAKHDRELKLITERCMEKIFNAKLEVHNQDEYSGIITGLLTYPSEGIPENMTICAFNVNTQTQYCTNEHISDNQYKNGKGYLLAVPAGNYYLYYKLDPFPYAVYGERDKKYSDTVIPFLLGIREGLIYTPEEKTENWLGWISSNYGAMYLRCDDLE